MTSYLHRRMYSEEWNPLPTRRTLIHNDVALYANPVYLTYRHEPTRTVVANWGEAVVVRTEHGYIWPEGTAREFHTFVLAVHSAQVCSRRPYTRQLTDH